MMRQTVLVPWCAAALVLLAAAPTRAQQPASPWSAVGFINLDGGVQAATSGFTSIVPFTAYGENGSMTAQYRFVAAPVLSGRLGFRIWRNIAFGVAVSHYSRDGEADVTAQVPHPFYFNRARSVSGTATGLNRDETLAALELSWRFKLSRIVDLMLFAGPAYFTTRQEMATKPRYTESYPYDAATFTGADKTAVRKDAVGFTAGLDLSFMLSPHVGLGAMGRYSHASTTFSAAAGSSTGVTLGGAQGTIGLRIRY